MSKKWRSSKTVAVDGDAFKQVRRLFINKDNGVRQGEYGYGSQEWLAEQARISPRTVNSLETGRATIKTVDAVSKVLNIKGREFILGYGADFTTLRAMKVVDFRPSINGRVSGNENLYLNKPFLVTLDPIVITVSDDLIDKSLLKNMTIALQVGDLNIEFNWLYKVKLTSKSSTWLGDEEDIHEVIIKNPSYWQASIMFRQDSLEPVSWGRFIDHVKSTSDGQVLLTVKMFFEYFEKISYIILSVEEIVILIERSFPEGYPYWIQPRALMTP